MIIISFYLIYLKVALCPPWSAKASWRRRLWLIISVISVHLWFNFVHFVSFVVKLPKMKANPFQTHPNPFFHTPIPVFGRISRIFDNFRKTFLCKANPIYYSESLLLEVPNLYDYTNLQSFFEFHLLFDEYKILLYNRRSGKIIDSNTGL